MKTTFKILVTVIALITSSQLISCKKDKKDDPSIVGTWQSKSYSYSIKQNGVTLLDSTENYTLAVVTFNADKTYTSKDTSDASQNDNGTYLIDGSKLYTTNSIGEKDTANITISAAELVQSGFAEERISGMKVESTYSIKYIRK